MSHSEDSRICRNCKQCNVDESKQTFTYRNWEGIKYDSSITPICDECIAAGKMEDEDGTERLYLGSSRVPKDEPKHWFEM